MTSAAAPPSAWKARPPERLEGAARDQDGRRGGGRADDRRDGVQRQAANQRRTAADAIAERPVGELAECKPGEERRQRRLEEAGRGAEVDGDGRQGRQVHVDRQRGDRRQDAQQEQQRRSARADVDGSGGGGRVVVEDGGRHAGLKRTRRLWHSDRWYAA
jgi:hypothetical protein